MRGFLRCRSARCYDGATKPPRADADPKEMDPTPIPAEVPELSDPVAPADPIESPETEIPESDPFEDQNFPL